jgi:hypothetical protein
MSCVMIELHELTMKNLKEEHLIKLKIMLDNSSNKCNCKKNELIKFYKLSKYVHS